MTPQTLSHRTFAEIAREMAKRRYPKSWRAYSDDTLNSLIHDFWCGRFMDGKGQSGTFDLSHRQGGAYDLITREVVWRTLGDNRPRNLWDFREGNLPPRDIVATAKIEDYGSGARAVFENLALSEADASAWMEQYEEENLSTGAPGKPSMMHLIFTEVLRRTNANDTEVKHTNAAEARSLRDWLVKKHPEGNIPTARTIENRIREKYLKYRAKHRT